MAPADYERKAKQMKNDAGPNEGARVERAVEGSKKNAIFGFWKGGVPFRVTCRERLLKRRILGMSSIKIFVKISNIFSIYRKLGLLQGF